MIKINRLAVIFWFFLFVALAMTAAAVADRGYVKVDKYFFAVLMAVLLVVCLVSLFLVSFRDVGKIPLLKNLRGNNVFVKGVASAEFGLVKIIDPETKESLLVSGAPDDLPKTFLIRNGKVENIAIMS